MSNPAIYPELARDQPIYFTQPVAQVDLVYTSQLENNKNLA